MTSDVLNELEQMLGRPVPDWYLQFLDNYPTVLRHAVRAIDESDSEGTVADVELIADLASILEINREAREDSVPEPSGLEWFWPEQFLIIGETGGGDYYCIDVDGDVDGVMQYDHVGVGLEVIADSIEEFVGMLVDTFIEEDSPDDDRPVETVP